jgi:magnesium transporter
VINVVLQARQDGTVSKTPIDDLSDIITKDHATIWVDLVDPTPEELKRIGEEFGFHPLALEDVARGGQRPKIDQYDGYQFIVFYGLIIEGQRCKGHEVDIFLGKNYLVTCHDSHLHVIRETAERWKANVDSMGSHGPGFLLYSLLDSLVDGYFPVLDEIAERADSLEETIIIEGQPGLQAEILQLRRDLLMIRRVVGPERDVMNVLVRHDPPIFSDREIVYFQDVYDHILRLLHIIDIERDMATGALEAQLSIASNRLNETMKKLTGWAAIIAVPTLVTSFVGMNVAFPLEGTVVGFWLYLLLMVVSGLALFAVFRSRDWV